MSKYSFSRAERYAVFTVHHEVCWLCREPVGLIDMQVDHIIPESIEGTSEYLVAKKDLGLSDDFKINSFENWMPAHSHCNLAKGGHIFKSTPMIQRQIANAAARADKARDIKEKYLSNRKIDVAINTIMHAVSEGFLSAKQRSALQELASLHESNRALQDQGKPLLFGPGLTVIREDGNMRLISSPTGMMGIRPKGDKLDPSWDCPNCGPTAWNGARCIICGAMNDE